MKWAATRRRWRSPRAWGIGSTQRLKPVPDATRISMWNRYIAGEYGGMNEVLARLCRLTGDTSFLEAREAVRQHQFLFRRRCSTRAAWRSNVDTLRGKHANQHIPQITGALETYRDTQERRLLDDCGKLLGDCPRIPTCTASAAWPAPRTPTTPNASPPSPTACSPNGFANGGQCETCATYNMLKLSRQLFMFDQDPRYMDYYEQALYNDILASVAENDPGNTYHIPLNPGARKQFGNARMDGFTCCNGTALESNTKLQDSIYFRSEDNKALYVNLFVPSKLTWTERKVTLTQHTDYPYADTTKLTVGGGGAFDLKVRVPQWATHGFFVKINGARSGNQSRARHVSDAQPDLEGRRRHRAEDAVWVPSESGDGPAEHRQPFLRAGAAGRGGTGSAIHLASDHPERREPGQAPFPAIRRPCASTPATPASSRSMKPTAAIRCIWT